jgi:MGT family glycosyltransferase
MSRICMLGHPAAGHVNPTLPVIAELVSRGEEVTYFSSEPFRARIEKTGARFQAYGAQALFERNLARGGILGGMAGLIETTETILPELLDEVRAHKPDYLLVEAHAVWGNLAVQVLELPAITLSSMLAINERLISSGQLIEHLYGAGAPSRALEGLQGLTAYFESARRLSDRYGVTCPGIINYLGNRQPLNIVFTSRDFQLGGEVFDESYKFVGPSLPAKAEDHGLPIPANGEYLIFISMGTMYNNNAGFYRDCFAAFRDWPVTAVMAVGHRLDRSTLPEPPQNFIVRDYVPQLAVLSQASLFITHGGLNSAHEAMFYGVPMLVLPEQADHYVVANQVEAVGAGITLDRRKATPALLSKLAKDILSEPRYRQKSAAMGESLAAAGGSKRAADEIFCFKNKLEIH